MKKIFCIMICCTFGMHAMQRLSEKECNPLEHRKEILTALLAEFEEIIKQECDKEKIHERFQILMQEYRDVQYTLKKSYPRKTE